MNTSHDFSRSNQNLKSTHKPYDEAAELTSNSTTPEESLLGLQLLNEITRLPKKLKETALLVFCEGFTHREAAETLSCAETTISWRIFQAKKHLKPIWQQGSQL